MPCMASCVFLFLVVTTGVSALGKIKVDPATGMMVDVHGNTRIFHGVNAVQKLPPFLPTSGSFDVIHSLADSDLTSLTGWGFNVVRLGVLWSAVTPTADIDGVGVVNVTYLAEVKSLIAKLEARGIYTIVDAHQDNLNPQTCGEGMPNWVFDYALSEVGFNRSDPRTAFPKPLPYDIPLGADGLPDRDRCEAYQFSTEGGAYEVIAAWTALYTKPEIYGAFASFWGTVAEALTGIPGVLGYELLNEPWPSLELFDDKKSLLPMYKLAAERIRQFDTETIILFEPISFDSYFSVFNHIPDFPPYGIEGPKYQDRQLFAYHSYCADFGNSTAKNLPLSCQIILSKSWPWVKETLAQYHLGGFLTEWGAVGDSAVSLKLLQTQADSADEQFQSWTYWTYKSFDDITTANPASETFFKPDGSLQTAKVKALARSYAQQIAGMPTNMGFIPSTGLFNVDYDSRGGDNRDLPETVIFVSREFYYPRGFQVDVSPAEDLNVTFSSDGPIVITHLPSLAPGSSVRVSITPM